MSSGISETIRKTQGLFGLRLNEEQIERCRAYYDLVIQHNARLHLVAPCPPEEFAVRHILESLSLLDHLPKNTRFADVGTGAGLPSIPCLIVRDDLAGVLIESKAKKADFLQLAINELGLERHATTVNKQFSETTPDGASVVTCRALDKFTSILPSLVKWSRGRRMLFFGGPSLEARLQELELKFVRELMPMSAQRYLFVIER